MNKLGIVLVTLGLLCGALLAAALATASIYNGMVSRAQKVDMQWAQVQTVYQRRADLIPNLVATVSGAAGFEQSTLQSITEARAAVGQVKVDPNRAPANASQLESFQRTHEQLGSALSRLLVVAERYPDLKATSNFKTLQAQLEGAENRVSVERQRFNEVVQDYNTSIKRFPNLLLAAPFGFKEKPYFTAAPGSESAPKVEFGFGKGTNPR